MYINRELSFLAFNDRVLNEAFNEENKLIERLKFLAITESNLDEFFMVRISTIWRQIDMDIRERDIAGLTPKEQLKAITKKVLDMVSRQYTCLKEIMQKLNAENIYIKAYSEINEHQKKIVNDYFNSFVFPILTPMAIDNSRPFPLLANKSLNIIAKISKDELTKYAVVQIPSSLTRFLDISIGNTHEFILVEDIIRHNLASLFEGYSVSDASLFRITRNSDLEIDEEDTPDLLKEIEQSLKRRKWGTPVRLEMEIDTPTDIKEYLTEALYINTISLYEIDGMIDLSAFMKFTSIKNFDYLKNETLNPIPISEFEENTTFAVLENKDILVYHPYESFTCVENFLIEASSDPNVLAIKQTLYRVSGNSQIVQSLITAAENGKQVTVVVEVKARFDEENNIQWAKRMEKAGCHVIYGLVGLKVHCKMCLVVRNEEEGIKRYVHLGTGNYNDQTARLYTDYGFFTSNKNIGQDVSALFNALTGYSAPPTLKKLIYAPTNLRKNILAFIDRERDNAKNGVPASIIIKANSLLDKEMIDHLYEASKAGVKINLIIRGICSLLPGIKNKSENIRVVSIVDRFLEHARVYYFENGGNNKLFLSSADLMPRNLDKRVEVAFPIEDESLKERVLHDMELQLSDNVKAMELKNDGNYIKVKLLGDKVHSQLKLYKDTKELHKKRREIQTDIFIPVTIKEDDDNEL